MDFYIFRHGIAEERSEQYPDDSERPLTSDGKVKTREAASGLLALEVAPDAIFTSPYVRAKQTAEIVAAVLGASAKLRETRRLEPGESATALLAAIREAAPGAASVMVVGHEPDLGILASRLLAGDGHTIDIPLKKAGAVKIELDGLPPAGRGTLRWVLTPNILRALGQR